MLPKNELIFLSCLRNGARKNLTSISKELNVPVSTLFEKLKRLERTEIIRHTSLIDFNTLGYSTRANILIKADRNSREELKNYLRNSEYVNSVFKITNGYDFMVEGIFRNMLELEQFSENLEDKFNIHSKSVYFIIDDIERENFLLNKHLIN